MIPWSIIKAPTMILGGIINSLKIKENIRWIQAEFATENMLQKKFVAIATYFRAIKRIYELLKTHPEVSSNLEHFNKLKDLFENKDLSPIFRVLEAHTFDREGWFYNLGIVLYLADQLDKPEVLKKFEPALAAIAEIDTFVSAAKLMDEFQEERVKFCFPKYLEEKSKPELHLGNSWNPLVDPKEVTCNSADFSGSDEDRCQLITGPNGGGKTTILRSRTGNIILGQSLGISSSETCTTTPFNYVASSMNIVDDPQKKESHFQSEVRRIAEIQKRVAALREDEFGYLVLDELYSGTSDEERAALGRAAVNDLGNRKNLLSMVVTHDKALPPLAEKEKSGIKNFRVLVDDQVKPPKPLYKLEPGISTQHIGLLVASQGGVSEDQIREAQEYLDHCKK
jgi:DNA mismatch repair ATPase MutS